MVEHRLAKARVASSNLVSRSKPPFGALTSLAAALLATLVGRSGGTGAKSTILLKAALPRRGTQVVRERSAKPLCAGSIPARASNIPKNLHNYRPLFRCPEGVLKAPDGVL